MTFKELITQLEKMPQESDVLVGYEFETDEGAVSHSMEATVHSVLERRDEAIIATNGYYIEMMP